MRETTKEVLESHLAGSWYAADARTLRDQLEEFLTKTAEPLDEPVLGLIQPHAGYRFSGETAAYGIRQIQGKSYRRIIVMGPSHQLPMENMASVPTVTHYKTPLGVIPIDGDFIDRLLKYPQFQSLHNAHTAEHSVQIQLPLLQMAIEGFSLVPIVVGELDLDSIHSIADILHSLIDDSTLIVASSDFTHYGLHFRYLPFRENIPEGLRKLDLGAYEYVEKKEPESFYEYINETGATICGRAPIAILLSMLPPKAKMHLLHYTTSGEMTGDYSHCVSYLSAAATGVWETGKKVKIPSEGTLSEEEKNALLKLARDALVFAAQHQRVPTAKEIKYTPTTATNAVRGAFVTLKKAAQLRGCIGDIFPSRPLYKTVIANALNAAFNDPRFRPVTASEINELQIEISMLTPPHPVPSYEDISIGKHGVLLNKEGRRAVFLPQVAPEQGWDLTTTLEHLSEKAGLEKDAWKKGASFEVFEAVVFHES